MLVYRIIKELAQYWHALDLTVPGGLKELEALCVMDIALASGARIIAFPNPGPSVNNCLRRPRSNPPGFAQQRSSVTATTQTLVILSASFASA
jgi:hypothetical protein